MRLLPRAREQSLKSASFSSGKVEVKPLSRKCACKMDDVGNFLMKRTAIGTTVEWQLAAAIREVGGDRQGDQDSNAEKQMGGG